MVVSLNIYHLPQSTPAGQYPSSTTQWGLFLRAPRVGQYPSSITQWGLFLRAPQQFNIQAPSHSEVCSSEHPSRPISKLHHTARFVPQSTPAVQYPSSITQWGLFLRAPQQANIRAPPYSEVCSSEHPSRPISELHHTVRSVPQSTPAGQYPSSTTQWGLFLRAPQQFNIRAPPHSEVCSSEHHE